MHNDHVVIREGIDMTNNMGMTDRVLRALIGIAALAAAVGFGLFTGWKVWAATAIGVIMLATAAMGFCPISRLVGINTCRI